MGFYEKWKETASTKLPEDGSASIRIPKPAVPPYRCPIVTNGDCPPECRFDTKLFKRMVKEGVLPDPSVGCPLRSVCVYYHELDEIDGGLPPRTKEPSASLPRCFNIPCEHGGYKQHGGIECLWCGKDESPVIDMDSCPLGNWSRDGNGMPVLKN